MKHTLLLFFICLLSLSGQAQTISLVKTLGITYAPSTEYVESDGWLYFAVNTQLWRTDGTAANTTMIKSFAGEPLYAFTNFKNKLYFLANDSIHGLELWCTSGTPQTTVLVKDIYPGFKSAFADQASSRYQVIVMDNHLYFIVDDGVHGYELYKSDGTQAGTQMVIDLDPKPGAGGVGRGSAHSNPMAVLNGRVYFGGASNLDSISTYGLWSSDGTDTGTHFLIKGDMDVSTFAQSGNRLYFSVNSPFWSGLWTTDGTVNGTRQVDSRCTFLGEDHATLGSKFFYTNHCSGVDSLLVTDGTYNGTIALGKCVPRIAVTNINGFYHDKTSFLTALNNKVYFINESELWSSDGTPGGTLRINPVATGTEKLNMPVHMISMGGHLYFKSLDSERVEVWRSNGTNTGTHRIAKPDANSNYMNLSLLGLSKTLSGNKWGIRSSFGTYKNELYFLGTYDTTLNVGLYKLDPVSNAVLPVNPQDVSLYPNPSAGLINIVMHGRQYDYLILTDQLGRQVYQQSINPGKRSISVQLPANAPGIYYLQLSGKDGSITQKVLLQ